MALTILISSGSTGYGGYLSPIGRTELPTTTTIKIIMRAASNHNSQLIAIYTIPNFIICIHVRIPGKNTNNVTRLIKIHVEIDKFVVESDDIIDTWFILVGHTF